MCSFEKHCRLRDYMEGFDGLAIAFSGGVDSTFLLKTAHEVLGDRVIAVSAHSSSFPERELEEAICFCKKESIRHFICQSEELKIEGFYQNHKNRCYLCKKEIFTKIWDVAHAQGIHHVAEGSNMDDIEDYRPGLTAIQELNVISPLQYAELTKDEIRKLSKKMGLSTWDKPSFACLASRFPYGEPITPQRLTMVDQAEQVLLNMGFDQVRVRFHGTIARIEVDPADFQLLKHQKLREEIYDAFKEIGFTYTALDLLGYRAGSLNEIKDDKEF